MDNSKTVAEIFAIYEAKGAEAYFGEQVTQLEHGLQAAHLACEANASDEVVLGALLHDIGHLLGGEIHDTLGVIDHDKSAVAWLRERGFSEKMIAMVEGHVSAKRYLTAVHPGYRERLSEASTKTLALQGGPMSGAEVAAFEANPWRDDLLRVRSWDEAAKVPGAVVPPLESYRGMLEAHLAAANAGGR